MTKTYEIPPPPPSNHGHTAAAWALSAGVLFGAALVGVSMVLAVTIGIWIGSALIALGLLAGGIMKLVGLGQQHPDRIPSARYEERVAERATGH